MDFHSRLHALGIDPSEVDASPVHRQIEIKDIQQLRSFVDVQGDEAARRARFNALFKGTPNYEDAQLRRAEEYVFGLGDDLEGLEAISEPAFPITVYAEAAGPLVVDGELDLSTANGELKRAVYSDVTIKPGGYIVAKATPLDFICDTMTLEGEPPAGMGHFNILGRAGAPYGVIAKPRTPDPGAKGALGNCGSNTAGHLGGAPTDGTPGTKGSDGNDGIPSQLASISVTKALTTTGAVTLLVATQSGAGGDGQDGQDGGDAGTGGDGGNGVQCGCSGVDGGPGHNGGTGGNGGRAGDGGNGVDAAANISATVPAADFDKVNQTAIATDAPPGKAGKRGAKGARGAGGAGGTKGKKQNDGAPGGFGADGMIGDPGNDGTYYGKPAKFNPQPR